MAGKVNIYIAVSDAKLKERLYQLITDDWTVPWNFVTSETNRMNPDHTDLAVLDDESILKTLDDKVINIFIGKPGDEAPFFTCLDSDDPERIYTELKRAYSYKEITIQNRESLYPEIKKTESLESIAQSLSTRVNQLMRQAEMRIALVDQLPVGVLGIDDEGVVVLINPKAIEYLDLENVPVWGMHLSNLLSEDVWKFLNDDSSKSMTMKRDGEGYKLLKETFLLNDTYAGTILVLTKSEN